MATRAWCRRLAPRRPRTPRRSISNTLQPADPATKYALDIAAGRIIAGPHVRNACKRHLDDLISGHERGLHFDIEAAARTIGFFADVLKLSHGDFKGRPFILDPWQTFIVGSLFGWKREDDLRRFREAYIETAKGSGKTPCAAGIGNYMLIADKEDHAEIYAAAVKKDQAQVLFRFAVAQVKQSPALRGRIKFSGGEGMEWNIAHIVTGSYFRPIATEDSGVGQSGPLPSCALIDELHEHKTNAVIEFMRAAVKSRRQPLILAITNAGVDRHSVCWENHEYGARVAAQLVHDDSFFAYVCALDTSENFRLATGFESTNEAPKDVQPDDDPFEDEACWSKVNPSPGMVIPGVEYLRKQVREARGMPGKESLVSRLNFCEWTDAFNPWIAGHLWRAAEVPAEKFDVEDRAKRPCVLGLDLSESKDLTACAKVWLDPDDPEAFDAELQFWTPEDTLEQRAMLDRVPYRKWVELGHLVAVPGMTIDYGFVAQYIADQLDSLNIVGLTFDQWHIASLRRELDRIGVANFLHGSDERESGLRLVRHGQGFAGGGSADVLWMERSIAALEKAVLKGKLRVKKNPALTWGSASAMLQSDAPGNRVWNKRKSTGRIDGPVALCMGTGLASVAETFAPKRAHIRATVVG